MVTAVKTKARTMLNCSGEAALASRLGVAQAWLNPLLLAVSLSLLSGCGLVTSLVGNDISKKVTAHREHIKDDLTKLIASQTPQRPLVRFHDSPYTAFDWVARDEMSWLQERVVANARELPLGLLMDQVIRQIDEPPLVRYGEVPEQVDAQRLRQDLRFGGRLSVEVADARLKALAASKTWVDTQRPVTLRFSGTMLELLERLSLLTDYAYTANADDNSLHWQAYLTRSFRLVHPQGDQEYDIGFSSGGGSNTGGVSAGGTGSVSGSFRSDTQYVGFEENGGPFWDDLETAVEAILDGDGDIERYISRATIVVTAPAAKVLAIGRFVHALNKELQRKMLIEFRVIEVTLNDAHNFGIDWSLIQSQLTGQNLEVILRGNALTIGGGSPPENLGTHDHYVNTVLTALRTQGEVSVETAPRALIYNHQAVEVRRTQTQSYISQISRSVDSFGSNISVTPGTIDSGVSFYALANILDTRRVVLQVSGSLREATIGEGVDIGGGSQVNLPSLTENSFSQRAILESGQSLLLSGLRRRSGNYAKTTRSDLDYSKNQRWSEVETIVMITPVVVN